MKNTELGPTSLAVAKAFLQTVVVVDDHAFPKAQSEAKSIKLTVPGRAGASDPVVETEAPVKEAGATEAAPVAELLDAPSLIKEFAKVGLICAVIDPTGNERIVEESVRASARADIVVLDWVMNGDHGATACEIIEKILKSDLDRGGRLRLIALYTGEGDLAGVIRGVKEVAKGQLGELTPDADSLALQAKTTRFVALAKEQTEIPEADTEKRKHLVSITSLPLRLQQEFSLLTGGLIANVAVNAMGTLRDTTHGLLARLGPHLDPAFLAHRILLPNPDDSIDHAVDLVADEVGAILHANDVGRVSGLDATRAAVKDAGHDPKQALQRLDIVPPNQQKVLDLLEKGHKLRTGNAEDVAKKVRLCTEVFAPDQRARQSEKLYAEVATLSHRYAKHPDPPILTLGTILKRLNAAAGDAPYLVCLQPRCDCARVSEAGQGFAFLPARPEEVQPNIVVQDGGARTLRVSLSPKDLVVLGFACAAGKKGPVEAAKDGESYTFKSQGSSPWNLAWIGQLKPAFSQRLSNRFATGLARVGLDEPEWLRRVSPDE